MGIQSQAALLFKSNEIEFNNIVYVIEQRHAERRRQQQTVRVRPKVTIDASLIGFKFVGNSLHPSDGVYTISHALANRNIDVLIICDPPTRHHSKRAHHQRIGKREKDKLQLMLSRLELSHAGDDSVNVRRITDEIRKLEKGECRAFLPSNFVERLHELVSKYNNNRKGEIAIEIAPFQADPSIADVALRGECEAIFSGDSDFAMYVGPGGPDHLSDIMVRDIKINTKQSTIKCCTLITGQREVANTIEAILSNKGMTAIFPSEPKYPLFNGVEDPQIRALIAIALGCDALPGGVPGLGASSLHNLLETCNRNDSQSFHLEFATKLANQKKALINDPHALLCLANSLMYEKTTSSTGYMYTIPKSIEKYNEAFAAEETDVFDGPTMIFCKGCDGREHAFLAAEGMSSCTTCKANLCRFCAWDETNNNSHAIFCLECKRYSIAGKDDEQHTEQEMRLFLREHAVNIPVASTYAHVLSLFHQFNDDEHDIFAEDINNVQYPLLPASTMNIAHDSSKAIDRIMTATVRDIGNIIRSSEVDARSVVGLIQVLASLTDIPQRKKGEHLSSHHVISQNLVNMATKARIHSSQRLLARGIRHATDVATPDIFDGSITLGRCTSSECNGDVCIIGGNKVRASMKNVEYEVKSAFTHNHFLAAEAPVEQDAPTSRLPMFRLQMSVLER